MPFSLPARLEETAETARRGLAYLKSDVSADRVASSCYPWAGQGSSPRSYELADEALKEGLNIASQLSDPKLEARVAWRQVGQ